MPRQRVARPTSSRAPPPQSLRARPSVAASVTASARPRAPPRRPPARRDLEAASSSSESDLTTPVAKLWATKARAARSREGPT
eukprot:7811365-Alexandrium_andersonii.AAC.1